LSTFFGTEAAIFYAHGVSVASSVLASPSVMTGKDIVFCFSKCHFGIKAGLRLNGKCTTIFVDTVEEIEEWIAKWKNIERVDKYKVAYRHQGRASADSSLGPLPSEFGTSIKKEILCWKEYEKRYVITEGIFQCDGTLCDLERLANLKTEYRDSEPLQLVVDESLSLGGAGLSGITERFGLPLNTVDLFLGSLEFSVGSIGGFCAGKLVTVRDLRLTSSGYCFSASAPGVSCLWSTHILSGLKDAVGQLAGCEVDIRTFDKATDVSDDTESHSIRENMTLLPKSPSPGPDAQTIIPEGSKSDSTTDYSEESISSSEEAGDASLMYSSLSKELTGMVLTEVSIFERYRRLRQNVAVFQDTLRRLEAHRVADVSGSDYVVYLRPRLPSKTSLTDENWKATSEAYQQKLEEIQRKVNNIVDLYRLPPVEYALNAWHGIKQIKTLPCFRMAVHCFHSCQEIQSGVQHVISAISATDDP